MTLFRKSIIQGTNDSGDDVDIHATGEKHLVNGR
jgi:hypothetical protein